MQCSRLLKRTVGILLAAGVHFTANAVTISADASDQRGQVLLFPAYATQYAGVQPAPITQANVSTRFSIENTSSDYKALKIAFREYKYGWEVLSFNIFLKPGESWVGSVIPLVKTTPLVPDPQNPPGGRVVFSTDTCTVPSAARVLAWGEFKNVLYANDSDGGGGGLNRAQQGHIEVVEMGVVKDATLKAVIDAKGCPEGDIKLEPAGTVPETVVGAPTGGLRGRLALNVSSGAEFNEYTTPVIALDKWSDKAQFESAGLLTPNLATGTSKVLTTPTGDVTFTTSIDAVSAALTVASVNLTTGRPAPSTTSAPQTSVPPQLKVLSTLTFPTKRNYVSVGAGAAKAPFTNNFSAGKSCEVLQQQTGATTFAPRDYCFASQFVQLGSPLAAPSGVPAVLQDTVVIPTFGEVIRFEGARYKIVGKKAGTNTDVEFKGLPVVVAVFDGKQPDDPYLSVVDLDNDSIPDELETGLPDSTSPTAKDNDVFTKTPLFVKQLYRDLLRREPTAAELKAGVDAITLPARPGDTRLGYVRALLELPEYADLSGPVIRLYEAYFLRRPDIGGYNFWYDAYQRLDAWTFIGISNFFATSPEFVQRYGSLDNRGFITLIYNNVLGRDPDVTGLNFWVAELDSGRRSRGQVMADFSESPENKTKTKGLTQVVGLYTALLKTIPPEAVVTEWIGRIGKGENIEPLVAEVIAKAEYKARFLP